MDSVEINVTINGKSVPLSTISTETFEKIKAKEVITNIPKVRIGNFIRKNDRLIFEVTRDIAKQEGRFVALDVKYGYVANHWKREKDLDNVCVYSAKPLEDSLL